MPQSSPASRIQANLQELFQGNISSGDAYIKFQLTPNIQALLSMKQVQESLIVKAENITPLPSMPEFTIGIMSSRDRVFCIFDLARLLTLTTRIISPRQYQIIVWETISEPRIQIGLSIMNLQGIMRLNSGEIESSNNKIDSRLIPFVSGVVQQSENYLAILEFNRILEALQTVTPIGI